MSLRTFPLAPTTTAQLEVGDFWAVPLRDGKYGCAVVSKLKRAGTASRKALVVGLLDWTGDAAPGPAEIVGAPIFQQGLTRIEAITKTGSPVLGNIRLSADLDDPHWFRETAPPVGSHLQLWGWRALASVIERHLAQGRSDAPDRAT